MKDKLQGLKDKLTEDWETSEECRRAYLLYLMDRHEESETEAFEQSQQFRDYRLRYKRRINGRSDQI